MGPADIKAEGILMQETVFRGKFDIAWAEGQAAASRLIEGPGNVAVSSRSGAAP